MPQTVTGEGQIPLKPGASKEVAILAEQFDGWLQWDRFELTETSLAYAYDDHVTIGTASDLEDFLETIAERYASSAWGHVCKDDVTYYGPSEQAKLLEQIAHLEIEANAVQSVLQSTRAKLADLLGSTTNPA